MHVSNMVVFARWLGCGCILILSGTCSISKEIYIWRKDDKYLNAQIIGSESLARKEDLLKKYETGERNKLYKLEFQ